MGCGKSHLDLGLLEEECSKYFDYIIILFSIQRFDRITRNKGWIRHDNNLWLIEPKGKLYQWIENFSL